MLDHAVSHDSVPRFLNQPGHDSKALWKVVKRDVRRVESDDGLLIIDDSISEKPHTGPNGLICPHYDHCKDRYVNGINRRAIPFVGLLYRSNGVQLPVDFKLVFKTLPCIVKTRKECWRLECTKNDIFRDLLRPAHRNAVNFAFVLRDSWFTNSEYINCVLKMKKNLIGVVKSNLEVALSK